VRLPRRRTVAPGSGREAGGSDERPAENRNAAADFVQQCVGLLEALLLEHAEAVGAKTVLWQGGQLPCQLLGCRQGFAGGN